MKNSIKSIMLSSLFILMTFSFTNVQAQNDKKVDKAMAEFCNSVNVFIESLIILDEANGSGSIESFNIAYDKAVKDWNKVEKAAAKLEKVEIKESVKAYNTLVESVNNMSKDGITEEEAGMINAILNASCQ